jgi:hypothetical protein
MARGLLISLLLLAGCSAIVDTDKYRGSGSPATAHDAGGDTGAMTGDGDQGDGDALAHPPSHHDAGPVGMDGGKDTALDAGTDAGPDGGRHDAMIPQPEAGPISVDAGTDAGKDAGPAPEPDAGHDAGPPPEVFPPDPDPAAITFKSLTTSDMSAVVVPPSSNAPIIFYRGKATNSDDLGMVVCANPTCSSTTTVPLEVPGKAGVNVHALIDRSGLPIVAYQDAESGAARFLRCSDATCSASNAWTFEQATPAGNKGIGQWSAIAIAKNGFPLVSYYDDVARDLRATLCNRPDCCEPGKTCAETVEHPPRSFAVAGATEDLGTMGSAAVGNDGLPVFAYYDATVHGLGFARCSDETCSAAIDTRVLDSADGTVVGQFTAMTLGHGGFPLIFYYDVTNKDLKLARCLKADCSERDIRVVDGQAGDVGMYASVAMPSDGRAAVTYFDEGNGHLMFLKCNDTRCSAPHTHRIDHASVTAGLWTSLTLRPVSELPVITFVTRELSGMPPSEHNRLTIAFCGNTTCVEPTP